MSEVNFRRSILGQFTDPSKMDLLFKQKLANFTLDWTEQFGRPLFKALTEADRHALVSLRTPLSNTQAEFDAQVLALTKTIIDSLNEAELAKATHNIEANTKGIGQLEAFLTGKGLVGAEPHIKFLRTLWNLRHGAGHRKGEAYERAADSFDVEQRGYTQAF